MSDRDPTIDLRELLDAPGTQFPDFPNLPARRYFYGKLITMEAVNSRQKGTPGYHFSARPTDPGKDVTKEELDAITSAGFSLADFTVGSDFWLTPKSMAFLWRFLESLGFSRNASLRETLSLDAGYLPTADTIEKIRGKDIMFQTPEADAQGRVFTNNLEVFTGAKR